MPLGWALLQRGRVLERSRHGVASLPGQPRPGPLPAADVRFGIVHLLTAVGRWAHIGACIAIPLGVALALLAVPEPPSGASYRRYREFWGGNPNEVYSHWINALTMSGSALMFSALIYCEAVFRTRHAEFPRLPQLARACGVAGWVVIASIAGVLDGTRGEGNMFLVHWLGFLPVLACSNLVLRQVGALVGWRPSIVAISCVASAAAHALAQYHYERSHTGAPNALFGLVWAGTLLLAAFWEPGAKRVLQGGGRAL